MTNLGAYLSAISASIAAHASGAEPADLSAIAAQLGMAAHLAHQQDAAVAVLVSTVNLANRAMMAVDGGPGERAREAQILAFPARGPRPVHHHLDGGSA